MQVEQTLSENLKHEYNITVPAKDVTKKIDARLAEIGKNLKMPGFRPGKVPMKIIKKNYGPNVMGEVLELLVAQSSRDAMKKEGIRPALQPKIEIIDFKEGSDLKYKIAVEILPEVPEIDFKAIKVEKPVASASDEDITKGIKKLAGEMKDYVAVKKARAAKKGDAVLIDFKGFLGDEAFAGGEAKGHQLVLGSNSFIPGFEDQLIGSKPGEDKKVKVSFPEKYHSEDLAGKDAVFEVTVHEVREAVSHEVDDALAQKLGLKDLKELEEAFRAQIDSEVTAACRNRAKKALFDALNEKCTFDVPQGMIDTEFNAVWKQVQDAKAADPEAKEFKKSEKDLKEEYQKMALRRVRLGILLSDIGAKNKIEVSQDELNQALIAEARQFPGQERKVLEHYKEHPEHLEALKGPILEEKVVDFILENVKLEEKKTSIEALQKMDEEEASE